MAKRSWTWTTTAFTFEGESAQEIADLCCAAGLSGIEGGMPLVEGLSDGEIGAFRETIEAAGLRIATFHIPFPPEDDIASFYETARKGAVERIRHAIEVGARLGATIGIQHPSTTRYDVNIEGLDRYLGQISRSLDALLPVAEALDFTIAIENMHPSPRFGSLPDHFLKLREAYNHGNVGFCLDTGHALISMGDSAAEIQDAMGDRLVAFHLADNAGDRDSHLAPGHGRVDWSTVFRNASDAGFSGTMCIETPPFAAGPGYTPEAWKQMVDDCEALVASA